MKIEVPKEIVSHRTHLDRNRPKPNALLDFSGLIAPQVFTETTFSLFSQTPTMNPQRTRDLFNIHHDHSYLNRWVCHDPRIGSWCTQSQFAVVPERCGTAFQIELVRSSKSVGYSDPLLVILRSELNWYHVSIQLVRCSKSFWYNDTWLILGGNMLS
ncbi:hypothetical protein HanXRQr2_Chr09g0389861 [Helianthus annuus]|uniref:Uncharacterized protein n=1 Tax=Helianthus annuus TaxID=4232 RepID=A0A9K3I6F9_HELAN|nr:hypothetical protein HanXRQr2_Chr09g0389861 [Helianthus annuus]KAJ0534486.1 hypothetical protein HanIR_Chr09g0420341 [Helianthus annuus]KAJ0893269.1 hypothetical protein HanPSC8_Chr09g0375731 [Helianthus annuus]